MCKIECLFGSNVETNKTFKRLAGFDFYTGWTCACASSVDVLRASALFLAEFCLPSLSTIVTTLCCCFLFFFFGFLLFPSISRLVTHFLSIQFNTVGTVHLSLLLLSTPVMTVRVFSLLNPLSIPSMCSLSLFLSLVSLSLSLLTENQ